MKARLGIAACFGLFVLWATVSIPFCLADGPADNRADEVRPIPPVGMEVDSKQVQTLLTRCQSIRNQWEAILQDTESALAEAKKWQQALQRTKLERQRSLTPEILVFPRAIEITLEFDQIYKERELESAASLLDEAERRIAVAKEDPRWAKVVGLEEGRTQQLVVGGYQSAIDDSYQPYALVVPSGFSVGDSRPRRLDLWFHGRGETLSEVNFLTKGRSDSGRYTPADTFVLHPYGRYSNAFKFAGEIDVLEAWQHVRQVLPVDDAKTSARGFSMGGAACWQFATHYADRFFAANPGAGFSETPEFLKSFQSEDLSGTPEYQRRLWRLYDCTYWSRNLIHCPTVAYSGEIDRQKQAADVMEKSLAEHGIRLVHVIGPDTGHQIHPDSKVEIERRMSGLANLARRQVPPSVDFTTLTLRYNRMHWIDVQGMRKHWEPARVRARMGEVGEASDIRVSTSNVTRLRLAFDVGQWPGRFPAYPKVSIDGVQIDGPAVASDRSWQCEFEFKQGYWRLAREAGDALRKVPGLQGPIDDAFLGPFLFVDPTGPTETGPTQTGATETGPKSKTPLQRWTEGELVHAKTHWRKHFRGDIRAVDDRDLTDEQIRNNHLVLFGNPDTNAVLRRIAGDLPVRWTEGRVQLGGKSYPADSTAVLMVYPNPLNPKRYVVLNSGFTFREYDYLNNARQTPKLPDWALVDVTDGSNTRAPGKVLKAGFFDESWRVRP